jgi:hypothetical protein
MFSFSRLVSATAVSAALALAVACACVALVPREPHLWRAALAGAVMLNAGLILRIVAEPAERMGHQGPWSEGVLAVSAVLHVAAILVIDRHTWGRVRPKRTVAKNDAA